MDQIQPKAGGGHTAASPSSTLCRAPVLRPLLLPPAGALMKQQLCTALAPRERLPTAVLRSGLQEQQVNKLLQSRD